MTGLKQRAENALDRIEAAIIADPLSNDLPKLVNASRHIGDALIAIHDNRRHALHEAATRLGALVTADDVVKDARVFAAYLNGDDA